MVLRNNPELVHFYSGRESPLGLAPLLQGYNGISKERKPALYAIGAKLPTLMVTGQLSLSTKQLRNNRKGWKRGLPVPYIHSVQKKNKK